MLLDDLRRRVKDWEAEEQPRKDGHCPECGGKLHTRRGNVRIHHWAHNPKSGASNCSRKGETEWHYALKDYYSALPGWAIEVRIETRKGFYIVDAYNEERNEIREFAHNIRAQEDAEKHKELSRTHTIIWVLDGEEFEAASIYNDYLTPKARDFLAITENNCWVHSSDGKMMRRWGEEWRPFPNAPYIFAGRNINKGWLLAYIIHYIFELRGVYARATVYEILRCLEEHYTEAAIEGALKDKELAQILDALQFKDDRPVPKMLPGFHYANRNIDRERSLLQRYQIAQEDAATSEVHEDVLWDLLWAYAKYLREL